MSMYGIIPILQVCKVLRKTVYVKNTSVTKIPVIDHSNGDHTYADVDLELCPTKDTRTRQANSESVQ